MMAETDCFYCGIMPRRRAHSQAPQRPGITGARHHIGQAPLGPGTTWAGHHHKRPGRAPQRPVGVLAMRGRGLHTRTRFPGDVASHAVENDCYNGCQPPAPLPPSRCRVCVRAVTRPHMLRTCCRCCAHISLVPGWPRLWPCQPQVPRHVVRAALCRDTTRARTCRTHCHLVELCYPGTWRPAYASNVSPNRRSSLAAVVDHGPAETRNDPRALTGEGPKIHSLTYSDNLSPPPELNAPHLFQGGE